MKTNAATTYLIMERGVEDVALLGELEDIFSCIAYSKMDAATRFPKFLELIQGLREEVRGQE